VLPRPVTVPTPAPTHTAVSVFDLLPDLDPFHTPDFATLGTIPHVGEDELDTPFQNDHGFYVAGLVDKRTKRTLVPARLSQDDRQLVAYRETPDSGDSWLYRAVIPVEVNDHYVTAYLAEASYGSGAAHANYDIACATWDRQTGKRLGLEDFLGAKAARHIGAADLPSGAYVDPRSIRLADVDGDEKLVLCLRHDVEANEMFVEELDLLSYPTVYDF
jgi:hypothetical protein